MGGLLDGILVLDFSEYIAGPNYGFLLADLGAEVIKVQPPDGSWPQIRSGKEGPGF